MDTADALAHPCIADVGVLNNFVHTGKAFLLGRILGSPVRVSPSVIDVDQLPLRPSSARELADPRCDFLQTIYMSTVSGYRHYGKRGSYASSFLSCRGELWEHVMPTSKEVALAHRLRKGTSGTDLAVERARTASPVHRLGVGEAEAAAIAVSRGWTLLTDDRATAGVVSTQNPAIGTLGTCDLLTYAVACGLLPCAEAADLYNRRIGAQLGHQAKRQAVSTTERLWLRCDPPKCAWDVVDSPGS